jgi:UDPglucose 6-dehydrogenase
VWSIIEDYKLKARVAIVGHGFVGRAVEFGFTSDMIDLKIVDPKYDDGCTMGQLIEWDPMYTFVCAPTPVGEDGLADTDICEVTILRLLASTRSCVIVKSTMPPQAFKDIFIVTRAAADRLIYNPEFLTENNALNEFVNPEFMIIGGDSESPYVEGLLDLYDRVSRVKLPSPDKIVITTLEEAGYIKYAINSFLAMKVTFFNQLFDVVSGTDNEYNAISKGVAADPRIGPSHTYVPGYDGKRGFGGACFPKDVSELVTRYPQMSLLKKAQQINNEYRSGYAMDDREVVNNVNYGQTKEEQS